MMEINQFLAEKGIYMLTIILFFLGIFGMATCGNYMKKLICMNIMQVAVIFFFLCLTQKNSGIITELKIGDYTANPLPHALMLTAIGTSGVGLALLIRIKEKYGTMEEEDIINKGDRK